MYFTASSIFLEAHTSSYIFSKLYTSVCEWRMQALLSTAPHQYHPLSFTLSFMLHYPVKEVPLSWHGSESDLICKFPYVNPHLDPLRNLIDSDKLINARRIVE